MSRHLSDEELDAVVMGAESHAAHLQECEVCREKLAEMRAMVGCFRESVLLWEPSPRIKGEIPRSAQNDNAKRYGWVFVPVMGLAAMLVVGVMVLHSMHERGAVMHQTASAGTGMAPMPQSRDLGHPAEAVVASNIAPTSQKRDVGHPEAQIEQHSQPSDDALMEQVQQQLDEDVPSSMTPLTALIQTDEPRVDAKEPMQMERMN